MLYAGKEDKVEDKWFDSCLYTLIEEGMKTEERNKTEWQFIVLGLHACWKRRVNSEEENAQESDKVIIVLVN